MTSICIYYASTNGWWLLSNYHLKLSLQMLTSSYNTTFVKKQKQKRLHSTNKADYLVFLSVGTREDVLRHKYNGETTLFLCRFLMYLDSILSKTNIGNYYSFHSALLSLHTIHFYSSQFDFTVKYDFTNYRDH